MTTEDETKAMSRLLTRGAKMLQKGCEDCGNPLFRYQGEVVCPVCDERRGEGSEEGGKVEKRREYQGASGAADTRDKTGAETVDASGEVGRTLEGSTGDTAGVEDHLHTLAEKLACDAVEHADDPEAVERRLDALERTLGLLRQ